MDYRLAKLYEGILKGDTTQNKTATLKDLYEATKKPKQSATPVSDQQSSQKEPLPSAQSKKPQSNVAASQSVQGSSVYDQVIAKALFGDVSKTNLIPVPTGNYFVGGNTTVNAKDMETYSILFPLTPPKSAQSVDTTMVGTKGSGNGEIALYWLLNKTYDIVDNRSASKPDLIVTHNSKEYGIEVKAYDSKKIGLGRFGDQHKNRSLLSIVFGLKALLNAINPQESSKRAPSLDTFNKDELIESFNLLIAFDSNKELRNISHKYAPISTIYQQIDTVLNNLGLQSGDFTAEKGASEMLLKLLKTKLAVKPGFNTVGEDGTSSSMGDGFLASVYENGKITYHQVTQAGLDSLTPEVILNNVNANGAALLIVPDALFSTKPSPLVQKSL